MYRDNLFRELIIDNFAGGGGHGAHSGKLCRHGGLQAPD